MRSLAPRLQLGVWPWAWRGSLGVSSEPATQAARGSRISVDRPLEKVVTRPRLQMGSPDRLRPGPPRPPPASAGNGRAPFSCCVLPAPPTEKAYRRAPSKGVPAQSTRRPLTVHSELGGSKLMTDTDCIQTLDRTPLKQLTGKGADLNHCSKQCFAWKS